VKVGIGDIAEPKAGPLGSGQIRPDVANRVDHGSGGLASAAKKIGRRDRVGVQELTQDHRPLPTGDGGLPVTALTWTLSHSMNMLND
jgi:hypothetical protein